MTIPTTVGEEYKSARRLQTEKTMDVTAADVIVGNHCFRLIVERQPRGGYRCQIFDNDKQITGGGAT